MDTIMKLLRYKDNNNIKPGILDSSGKIKDASSIVSDWNNETININNLNHIRKTNILSLPAWDA